MDAHDAPVLPRLADAFHELAQQGWSDAQRRQIAMVRGQMERAVASGLLPAAAQIDLGALLGGQGRRVFLELAEEGVFRRPDRSFRRPSTVHTANILVLWTERLAAVAGVETEPVAYRFAQREPVGVQHLRLFSSFLAGRVDAPEASVYEVRFTAMALVVLETALGVGALGDLELSDVSEDRRRLLVSREEPVEWAELSAVTATALRRWQGVREPLVARLQGGQVRALWVSLRTSHGRPPGMPLHAHDGIIETWAAGVSQVNEVMGGFPGWPGPMSVHMESLRRGVVAHRLGSSES